MKRASRYLLLGWICCAVFKLAAADEIFIRASQIGYHMNHAGRAIAFSRAPVPTDFSLVAADDERKVFFHGKATPISDSGWGQFTNHVELDLSSFHTPGRFRLKIGDARSLPITVGNDPFGQLAFDLLEFMRQQRCGYNPWLGTNCHQLDGRTAFGPLPAGTQLDARGGWHDAGDLLKYLITSANATAQMLLAYELGEDITKRGPPIDLISDYEIQAWKRRASQPPVFPDRVNALGQPGTNGIPDVIDEARWGLDWMLKLHPAPDALYHMVADDRDHYGWRLPQDEQADYGWGKGGARVVYFADGQPQGLMQFKSVSTGVANLAGRYAAAMALAYQYWIREMNLESKVFARRCLMASKEVYALGRAKEGSQQGNSYKAPYRYEETTWADDMEWGAAELFRATRDKSYLEDAKRYAKLAADEGWMGKEQTGHYQYYPFMNAGHFRLYDLVDRDFKKLLAGYYRAGIERCVQAGQKNPYRLGVPFIWCSNNLVAALVTQCLMYERMTGDPRYHDFCAQQRDWLLGRNPWGTTMFTEIGGVFPTDVHLMTTKLTGRRVRGGLVDGPVYDRIFKSLKGIAIREPDPFAAFQGPAVYHDDIGDYSTNEPTMDGTSSAILMFALCANEEKH